MVVNKKEEASIKLYAKLGKVAVPLLIALCGWVLLATHNNSVAIAAAKENTIFTRNEMTSIKSEIKDLKLDVGNLKAGQGNININIGKMQVDVNSNKGAIEDLNTKYNRIMDKYVKNR